MKYFYLLVLNLFVGASLNAQYLKVFQEGDVVGSWDPSLVELQFNSEGEAQERLAKYSVAQINITTTDNQEILTKTDYVDCQVEINHPYKEWCYTGTGGIRGRGNSSWLWYDKKPYRLKLSKKASLLGMGSGKSWVFLANYRDPTNLMNSYVFLLGKALGLQYTNDVRYALVNLNGKNIGLYQITEQVQQGKGRVNIDEKEGILLSLDSDDGPYLSPDATDNFWSSYFYLPVCVKNPDNPTDDQLWEVKKDFAQLERAIYNLDYDKAKKLLDMGSFIDYLIIQEFVYNVELDSPRSMYMYKDKGEDVYHMGPLWDFDAGYDFDWSTMYTGHDYFEDYRELVMGTSPATHDGTQYWVSEFFTNLFFVPEFVSDYKARWNQIKSLMWSQWLECKRFVDADAFEEDSQLWPIGKDYNHEIDRMERWISLRLDYMDKVINNY